MTPVLHCSAGNISLFSVQNFKSSREIQLRKCLNSGRRSTLASSSCQRLLRPQPAARLVGFYNRNWCSKHRPRSKVLSAVEANVTVEEDDTSSSGEVADENSETATASSDEPAQASPAAASTIDKRRIRTGRSDMPPVKDEDLVLGASFTGKVKAIQPFGIFVDFGAFTDGLVHISRINDDYVKEIASLFTIGQEVKVRVLEVNKETRRISLTMRDSDDPSKVQEKKEPRTSRSRSTPRPDTRRDEEEKTSKFEVGQVLNGAVKNLTRSGAFVSLPEGEEGYLPSRSEEDDNHSSFEVGQLVEVEVLRIVRGRITLRLRGAETVEAEEEQVEEEGGVSTERKQGIIQLEEIEEDRGLIFSVDDSDDEAYVIAAGPELVGTNPFGLAFRKNKEISAFLDELERARNPPSEELSTSNALDVTVDGAIVDAESGSSTSSDQLEVADNSVSESRSLDVAESITTSSTTSEDDKTIRDKLDDISATGSVTTVDTSDKIASPSLEGETSVSEMVDAQDSATDSISTNMVNRDVESSSLQSTPSVDETAQADEHNLENLRASSTTHDSIGADLVSTAEDKSAESEESFLPESSAVDELPVTAEVKEGEVAVGAVSEVGEGITEVAASEPSKETTSEIMEKESVVPVEDEVAFTGANDAQKGAAEAANGETGSIDQGSTITGSEDELSVTAETNKSDIAVEAASAVDESVAETVAISLSVETTTNDIVEEETVALVEKEVALTGANDAPEGASNDKNGSVDQGSTITGSEENSTLESSVMDNSVTTEAKEDDAAVDAVSEVDERVPEVVASSQSQDKTTNDSVQNETAVPVEKELVLTGANGTEIAAAGAINHNSGNSDQASTMTATVSPALVKQLREETGAGMMDCKKALAETGADMVKAQEFLRKKGLASADKKASRATAEGRIGSYVHDNRIGVLIEVNCETDFVSRGEIFKELVDDLAMQVAACPQVQYLSTEDVPEEIVNKEKEIESQKEDLLSKPDQIRAKIVEGRIKKRLDEFALLEQPYIKNDKVVIKDWIKQTIATIGENMKVKRFVRYNLGEGLEKKSQDFAAEVAAQTAAKASVPAPKDKPAEPTQTVEKAASVAISAGLVKQLREDTGAGMMDCKKALSETEGDLERAKEYLRKKGLSSADKKSSRLAAEGLISSYIHDSRIGCLIEVNSETDFVARNEKFKELVNDLAMQVVACPQVQYVSVEDIPESIRNKEKEIEMQREDLQSKPENIREKIVEGRIMKRLGEVALLEQPFIKDDSKTVKDLVKETVATLGENIKVRRFVRYTLGENKD